jgi:hypothetical protein
MHVVRNELGARSDNEMTSSPTPAKHTVQRDPTAAPKSAAMRQADVANGENPEVEPDEPAPEPPQGKQAGSHRTGEHQAKEDLENDPPA